MARKSYEDMPAVVLASAAAVNFAHEDPQDLSAKAKRVGHHFAWQREAQRFEHILGEIWFAHAWVGNAMSRIRWEIGLGPDRDEVRDKETEQPLPGVDAMALEAAETALGSLQGRAGTQSEWARAVGSSLSSQAETYLIGHAVNDDFDAVPEKVGGEPNPGAVGETWEGYAATCVEKRPMTKPERPGQLAYFVQRSQNGDWTELPADATGVRIWRRGSAYPDDPSGPMRALLNTCRRLDIVDRGIEANLLSRIPAGVLLIPQEGLGLQTPQVLQYANPGQEGPPPNPVITEFVAGMATPINDSTSGFQFIPTPISTKAEYIKDWRLLQFARQVDPEAAALAERLIRRIATGLDMPPEILLGLGDVNHWCVDLETEALTPTGWIAAADLVPGMVIRCLDHTTGLAVWSPVRDVYRADVVDEPMVSIESLSHSSLTTPDHRWPTTIRGERQWRQSARLRFGDHLTTAAPSGDTPSEPKYTDAFVELVAWFWTEGNIRQGGTGLSICQSHTVNIERVALIRAALTAAFGPAVDSLRGSCRPAWRETIQSNRSSLGGPVIVFYLNSLAAMPIINVAPDKRVSPEFVVALTAAQRELFINRSLQGDGQHYKQRKLDLFARDQDMLVGLELAGVLGGYTTTIRPVSAGWRLNLARKASLRPVKAAAAAAPTSGGMKIGRTQYTGTISCPVTDQQTWLARRRGTVYYTGNTAWVVSENSYREHLASMAALIADGVTVGFLWPAMRAAGVDRDVARTLYVKANPVDLVSHPDRTLEAEKAFDRGAISWAALREAKDFEETDAPTPEELLERAEFGFVPHGAAAINPVNASSTPGDTGNNTVTPGPPSSANASPSVQASGFVPDGFAQAVGQIECSHLRDVLVAADGAVEHALDMARKRLRSWANGDPTLKAQLTKAPNESVPVLLGRRNVDALVATRGGYAALFAGSFDSLVNRYRRMTADAQTSWRELVSTIYGLGFSDEDTASMTSDALASEAVLEAGVAAVAAARLMDPDAHAVTNDEQPSGVTIPASVVRRAAARAGGGAIEAGVAPLAVHEGGLCSGKTASALLSARGLRSTGSTWVYGQAPRRGIYQPHRVRDGAALNGDGHHPGEVAGCCCVAVSSWERL